MKKIYVYFLTLSLFVQMMSCDSCKTTPNLSDTTPPTIDWTITNKATNEQTKINGSGSVTFNHGVQLTITACVNDDGGVKELTSSSIFGYSCSGGGIGQNVGPSLGVVETTPLGLDDNGKAWSRYCRFYSVNLNFACSSGLSFNSGSYSFNLSGKNFADLTSSATLTVNVVP